jgi:hypothetical protein
MKKAVTLRLNEDGPALLTDHPAGFLHGASDGNEIHAVNFDCGNAKHWTAGRQTHLPGLLPDMGGDRIEIVLQKEDNRQIVQSGDVHGLVGGPCHKGSVAEEADRDVARAEQFVSQTVACRVGQVPADNRAGARNTSPSEPHVHGTTTAAAKAGV